MSLFQLVITVILTRQVDSYFISKVCISIYYLICCYQDKYNQIVQNLLPTQSNEQVAHRLANAFKKLTEHINFLWKYVEIKKDLKILLMNSLLITGIFND